MASRALENQKPAARVIPIRAGATETKDHAANAAALEQMYAALAASREILRFAETGDTNALAEAIDCAKRAIR